MCTGRVDLAFVLRAFQKGADGVIIGGCWPGECHYVTEGNYDALANMYITKMLLTHLGISPDRMRLEWIAASEGTRFAEVMSDFVDQTRKLGPLGEGEGIDKDTLQRRLEAASQLVPMIKIVEREKLRPSEKKEEVYRKFYESDEVNRAFDDLVESRLVLNQILLLLADKPLPATAIGEQLGLPATEVAEHIADYSQKGVVVHDLQQDSYALAPTTGDTKLVAYYIDPDLCQACLICMRKCDSKAIDGAKKTIHVIKQDVCASCGVCYEVCPPKFNAVKRLFNEPVPPPIPEQQRTIERPPKQQAK